MQPVAARFAPTLLTWITLAVAGLYPIDNTDTFGHLALGRQIALLGRTPEFDSFSYFQGATTPYVNYEWLSDWLFFEIYRAGGWNALHGLKLALLAVLAGLLVRIAHNRAAHSGAWLVPLFTVACLPAIRFRLSVRPHLFGLVLSALLVLGLSVILTRNERRLRIAWVLGLAIAHVAWVNLHGSHLLGIALVVLAGMSAWREPESRTVLALLLLLMLGASCLSPYGPRIALGAIQHSLDPRYRGLIDEWRPYRPGLSLWYLVPWLWQLAWLGASFVLRRPSSDTGRRFETLYTLLLLLMAAGSLRFFADAAALTVPVIAGGVGCAWDRRSAKQLAGLAVASVLGCMLAIAGCLALPPRTGFGIGMSTRGRPVASAQWLAEELPRARILATMSDAWDLMFSLPEAKFLLDGRSTFYGPEHLQRIQYAWTSRLALRQLIDETRTDVLVLQPAVTEQQTALQSLASFDDFRLVSIETDHCVFARVLPEREQLLEAQGLRLLQPGYEPAWLLSAALDTTAVRAELARLPQHENVAAYRSWVEGMLALRAYARDEARAGISTPVDADRAAGLRAALARLRTTDEALQHVQTVAAYRGLAAVSACQLDEAQSAFERALKEGPVREIGFGQQELALRRGERERVADFVRQARRLPEADDDPWLAALERELADPPRCPMP